MKEKKVLWVIIKWPKCSAKPFQGGHRDTLSNKWHQKKKTQIKSIME